MMIQHTLTTDTDKEPAKFHNNTTASFSDVECKTSRLYIDGELCALAFVLFSLDGPRDIQLSFPVSAGVLDAMIAYVWISVRWIKPMSFEVQSKHVWR